MRVRMIVVVAAVAAAGLAVFAASGVGGQGSDLRSLEPGFPTERVHAEDLHRVAAPSGQISPSALAEASKKKKGKITYFVTNPLPLAGSTADAGDLPCPKGKAVNGFYLADNEFTLLASSAPSVNARRWLVAVRNFDAAPTQVVLGVACARGLSVK
jgi:hypothetical protein